MHPQKIYPGPFIAIVFAKSKNNSTLNSWENDAMNTEVLVFNITFLHNLMSGYMYFLIVTVITMEDSRTILSHNTAVRNNNKKVIPLTFSVYKNLG